MAIPTRTAGDLEASGLNEGTKPGSAGGRLLLPWSNDLTSLAYDLLQRYSAVAKLLDRLLTGAELPVRILEVGCNRWNVLPRLLDPHLVQVTRCDLLPYADDSNFFLINKDQPLPVAGESFDAVVALEVLEHMPADRRRALLSECLRVARHGAVFTCPNGVPEVVEAENLAAAAYHQRHGSPHPFLREHREFGVPACEEILAYLRDLDYPHAVFDHAPLDVWLALLLLAENLDERQALAEVQGLVVEPFLRRARVGTGIPYRKIYVVAKTFDATLALQPLPELAEPSAGGAPMPPAAAPLHHLSVAASEALCKLADANRLHQAEVTAWQAEARDWRLQYLISHSFVQSLSRSHVWKLLRPLRAARDLVRPRGFGASDLIPWHQLEPDREAAPGTWVATGSGPHFIVPCVLPAGWLRFRLRMTTEVAGRLELSAIGGNGVGDFDCLKQVDVRGRVERDDFVYLRRAALGLRLDPLNGVGRFRVDALQVSPVPPLMAGLHALRNKLAALRRYGLVKRALANGLGLLLRGRLVEFFHKLHDGLHWPRTTDAGPVPAPPASPGENPAQGSTPAEDGTSIRPNPARKLDIVYVLKNAGLCGGVKVVLEHASRLRARGHNVGIYYLAGGIDWFKRPVPAVHFDSLDALKAALGRFRGIKVATWYETAPWVVESLRPGDRGYYLVQDIEECYCTTPEEAEAALATYRLGLKPITEGVWVRDQLNQRFGQDSAFVSIGLDFDVFQPVLVGREPQRILTQARTWSGGGAAGARLKGWETARNTVLRCFELHPQTTLTTFSMEGRQQCAEELPHFHFQLPSDGILAKLYSQAGLYLLTSTHEGFGLTAAEAMACGCPVVATYAQGNEEFCIDGYTALMARAGDVEQLARHCVSLQSDPSFAAELGTNGRRFILNYTWDRVIDRLEREFLQSERPEPVIERPAVPAEEAPCSDGEYPDLQLAEKPALDCTVVIPTVNDAQRVVQCISSCRQQLPAGAEVEFLVVDDGTRDPATREGLRRASNDLGFRLLYNHQNLGFSATVNHGMRHARGRSVVLCNNDIVFFQPWLEALEKAFDADPDLGILGAKLLYPNGALQHAGVDKVPGQLRWHHAYGGWPGDHPRANQSRYVWSVTGALLAVRRDVLRRLGGFSTAYATAYEDLDYCLHAWSHGVRVGYCAELAAYHQEGGTRGATTSQKHARPLVWAERERAGGFYFEKKWAALRQVESFEALLRRPRRQSPFGGYNARSVELSMT